VRASAGGAHLSLCRTPSAYQARAARGAARLLRPRARFPRLRGASCAAGSLGTSGEPMSQPLRGGAASGGLSGGAGGVSQPSCAGGDTQVLTAGLNGGAVGTAPLRLQLAATPSSPPALPDASAPPHAGGTQLLPPAGVEIAAPGRAEGAAEGTPAVVSPAPPPAASPPADPAAAAAAPADDAAPGDAQPPGCVPPAAAEAAGAPPSGGPSALALTAAQLACAARAVRRDFSRAGRGDAERAVRMTVTVAEVVAAKEAAAAAGDSPLDEQRQDTAACYFMLARHDLRRVPHSRIVGA